MNTRLVAVLRRWMTSSAAFFIFFVQLIQTCTFVLRRSASSQYFFMCVAWNHLVVNTFGGGPACFTGSFVRTIYSSWQVTASGLLPVPIPSNDPMPGPLACAASKLNTGASTVAQPIVPCALFSLNQLNHSWQSIRRFASFAATVPFYCFVLLLSLLCLRFVRDHADRHEI